MADTEPQMEVEQQEEEVVEEVSNAEEAASEVVEEVEGGAETKEEEDATEEDAEAEEEASSWISFQKNNKKAIVSDSLCQVGNNKTWKTERWSFSSSKKFESERKHHSHLL